MTWTACKEQSAQTKRESQMGQGTWSDFPPGSVMKKLKPYVGVACDVIPQTMYRKCAHSLYTVS